VHLEGRVRVTKEKIKCQKEGFDGGDSLWHSRSQSNQHLDLAFLLAGAPEGLEGLLTFLPLETDFLEADLLAEELLLALFSTSEELLLAGLRPLVSVFLSFD